MKINTKNDIYLSIFLHLGLVLSFILFISITKNKFEDLTYVEVSFGLNEDLVQTSQLEDKKLPEGERLATKSTDRLPQLTKDSAPIAVDSAVKPQNDMAQPKSDMTLPRNDTQPKNGTVKSKNGANAKLQNEKSGNLEMKDFLKRKEEALRKTGNKTQTGQKEVDTSKKVGRKISVDDIPRSPFDTIKVPKAPISAAPTGIESGSNTQAFDIYKTYLRNQLKLNWNIPDISQFPATLATIVSFTVNEFGYLIGNPKVIESSKNSEFDKLVIEAVIATFPVSNPPPKEVHAPQTFMAKYNSRDVK